jgi:hypothetical protein
MICPLRPPAFGTFAREWLELQKVFGSNAHYLDRQSLLETHLIPFFGAERQVATSLPFTGSTLVRSKSRLKLVRHCVARTASTTWRRSSRFIVRH